MAARRQARFGISRSHRGSRILDGVRQVTDALGSLAENTIRVRVAYDYDDLLRSLLTSGVELAWLPPIMLAKALGAGATLAAICERNGGLTYRTALLVRADSRFRKLTDLAGARPAWTEASSASGYLFPRMHCEQHGIALAPGTFTGSFADAVALMARGEADFCGTFAHGDSVIAATGLRILDETGPIPNDGMVIAPHVGAADRLRLTSALQRLETIDAGRAALRLLFEADRLLAPTEPIERAIAQLTALLATPAP